MLHPKAQKIIDGLAVLSTLVKAQKTLKEAFSSDEDAIEVLQDVGVKIKFAYVRGQYRTILSQFNRLMSCDNLVAMTLNNPSNTQILERIGFLKSKDESLVTDVYKGLGFSSPRLEAQKTMRLGEKGVCRLYSPRLVLFFLLSGSELEDLPKKVRGYFAIAHKRGLPQDLMRQISEFLPQKPEPEAKVLTLLPKEIAPAPPPVTSQAFRPEPRDKNESKTVYADASSTYGMTVIAVWDPAESIGYVNRIEFESWIEVAEAGAIRWAQRLFPRAKIVNDNKNVVDSLAFQEEELRKTLPPDKRFTDTKCTLRAISRERAIVCWEGRNSQQMQIVDRLTKLGQEEKSGKFKVSISRRSAAPGDFDLRLERLDAPQPTSSDPKTTLQGLMDSIRQDREDLRSRMDELQAEMDALNAQESVLKDREDAFRRAIEVLE